MKKLKMLCLLAIVLDIIGLIMLLFQPGGCSPFVGVVLTVSGLVVAICAWIFWHFIKYD